MPNNTFSNWHCNWSGWQLDLALSVVLITYDQGTEFLSYFHLDIHSQTCSHLPHTKRHPRRPHVQDTAH
jgi:hypothetical protein